MNNRRRFISAIAAAVVVRPVWAAPLPEISVYLDPT
jgi:hypothetical protein